MDHTDGTDNTDKKKFPTKHTNGTKDTKKNMKSIKIDMGVVEKIIKEGERFYPNECCGFLLGEVDGLSKTVSDIIVVDNRREVSEQYHRFVILPEDFMRAEKTAAQRGLDIAGIYHSHPGHPARPSDYDREHALPFYSYLIVSVNDGKAGEMASWVLGEDRTGFEEENINHGQHGQHGQKK